jgi:hypothetical protein
LFAPSSRLSPCQKRSRTHRRRPIFLAPPLSSAVRSRTPPSAPNQRRPYTPSTPLVLPRRPHTAALPPDPAGTGRQQHRRPVQGQPAAGARRGLLRPGHRPATLGRGPGEPGTPPPAKPRRRRPPIPAAGEVQAAQGPHCRNLFLSRVFYVNEGHMRKLLKFFRGPL